MTISTTFLLAWALPSLPAVLLKLLVAVPMAVVAAAVVVVVAAGARERFTTVVGVGEVVDLITVVLA